MGQMATEVAASLALTAHERNRATSGTVETYQRYEAPQRPSCERACGRDTPGSNEAGLTIGRRIGRTPHTNEVSGRMTHRTPWTRLVVRAAIA
jgi:hypothetical protein